MAEAQQARVQKAVEEMLQSLEKDHIREMQVRFMFMFLLKTEYKSNGSRHHPGYLWSTLLLFVNINAIFRQELVGV